MPVTAVRDEGALRMWVCRLPVHIDPAGCTAFYGNLRRIRTASQILNARLIYRSDSNATTYKFGVL